MLMLITPQQRLKRCMQLMNNGGFEAAATLLERQAVRLENQARFRREAKAKAEATARQAQIAQAEARQATSAIVGSVAEIGNITGIGNGMGNHENIDDNIALRVASAAAAAEASEVAAATAASAASKGERWMGAESLSILLGGLVDTRTELHRGSEWVRIIRRTCTAIMRQVSVLSEEELKKENQEVRAT